MARDLKLKWDTDLMTGDLALLSGDLESDAGIETAVIISLFTDRRAANDDPLPDDKNIDRRGWWGDLISFDIEGDEIGSKLWLLSREKTIPETLARTKQYLDEALAWLVEDGVATKVENFVERQGTPGNDILAYWVTIHKNDGREINLNFDMAWEGI